MIFGSILAGGLGTRMNKHSVPKQFINLCGKPIIIYTLEKMLAVKDFEYLYIAIHPRYKEHLQNILESFNYAKNSRIIIVEGGEERIDSVQNVVNAVYNFNHNEDDILVVHDAVRPFVSKEILLNSIKTASKYGICVAVTPAIDTMYVLDHFGSVIQYPDRKNMFNGQAPDSFKLGILKESLESLTLAERTQITGTVQICSIKGYSVMSIPGDYKNIKITTENDLVIAESFLKNER